MACLVQAEDGRVVARGTGEFEDIPADLVLVSIGYRSVAVEGAGFDPDRGVVLNRCRCQYERSRTGCMLGDFSSILSRQPSEWSPDDSHACGIGVADSRGMVQQPDMHTCYDFCRAGRVLDSNGQVLEGVYACGWLMRGPSGIIGEIMRSVIGVPSRAVAAAT